MTTQNTQRIPQSAARARLRQLRADMPENQRSRGGLLMRARLFTWLNAARDPLPHDYAKYPEDTAVRCARDCANCAPTCRKTSAAVAVADARKLFTWLNAARDEAVKAAAAPPSWPRSGPWRTNPTCARCSSNGGSRHHRGAAGGVRTQRPAGLPALDAGRPHAAALTASRNPPRATNCRPTVLAPTLGFTPFGDRGLRRRLPTARWLRSDGGQPFTAIGIAWSCGERTPTTSRPNTDPLDAIPTEDGWVPEAAVATRQGRQDVVFLSARLSSPAPPAPRTISAPAPLHQNGAICNINRRQAPPNAGLHRPITSVSAH